MNTTLNSFRRMDPELLRAIYLNNVEFLEKAVHSQTEDYFLCTFAAGFDPGPNPQFFNFSGNIFHISFRSPMIFNKAMELLPPHIKVHLLSEKYHDYTVLHMMVRDENFNVRRNIRTNEVKLMLDFFKSYPGPLTDDQKPWLMMDGCGNTPLHLALSKERGHINEELIMEILSMDGMEQPCATVNDEGISPLYYAIERGCRSVAEKILTSFPYSCSVACPNGSTPLHFAPNCQSEIVLRLLRIHHKNLMEIVDDHGFNVLHKWAEIGEVWPLNIIYEKGFPEVRNSVFNDLINQTTENDNGDSPLHTAMRNNNIDFIKALVDGYINFRGEEIQGSSRDKIPFWKVKTVDGFTPFNFALSLKHEDLALFLLHLDSSQLNIYANDGFSPLLQAVYSGCGIVVQRILETIEINPLENLDMVLHGKDGRTILHYLPYITNVDIGVAVLEKFWWMMSMADKNGKTPLSMAKELNALWLVNLLEKPIQINRQSIEWIQTCESGNSLVIFAFIESYPDLQELHLKEKDTPLHHIKLQNSIEYSRLLKNPAIAELKNALDHKGATPLHQAIRKENIMLAKELLRDLEVERNIKDEDGKSAMDLLREICSQSNNWDSMCKTVKVNPNLKTYYIKPGTNIGEVRTTLSVVAALMATITFAAGFTLPGGLNEESGTPIFAKNAAFIVFLLSDAFAMCASMIVLFFLIWSMASTGDTTKYLIDRSVWILTTALDGTMVAFMTGIYVVVSHNSLWAAIFIIVMCSLSTVISQRTILTRMVERSNSIFRDRNPANEGNLSLARDDDHQTLDLENN